MPEVIAPETGLNGLIRPSAQSARAEYVANAKDGLSEEEIMAELIDVHSRWPTMGIEERRRFVELVLEKIAVSRGSDVQFSLFYVSRFEELTALAPPCGGGSSRVSTVIAG